MSEHFSQSAHDVSRETQRECACGNDARSGHWDCRSCHALAQSVYRLRQIDRRKQATSDHFRGLTKMVEKWVGDATP